MAGEAAAAMTAITTLQCAFYMIANNEDMTACFYPKQTTGVADACYDHIVVGVGTAGSVMAGRLSQYATVLAIEAGVNPPLEAQIVATFPLQARTQFDYNLTSTNDVSTASNLRDNAMPITIGKMLGGSSSLDHLLWIPGEPDNYLEWEKAANDSSWNYEGLLPYFKKSEKILDGTVSDPTKYHGTDGPISISTETNIYNEPLYAAFEEMGCPVVEDITGRSCGACKPLIKINSDKTRSNNAMGYIANTANRNNLALVTNATVTRLVIDSNNKVTGVEYIDSTGETKYACANKEVIVSCGGIQSPILLMKSGIGPKEELEAAGITVVADLPVGQRMQDHNMVLLVHTLNYTSEDEPAIDPGRMNIGLSTAYMNYNSSQSNVSDYQAMNILFWKKSSAMFQMCLNAFLFTEDFCQTIYDGAGDKMYVLTGISPRYPETYGSVQLTTTGEVNVTYGYYKDKANLEKTANYLADFHRKLMNTTYAKDVGSEMLPLSACSNYTLDTTDYWECHAPLATVPMWHYIKTCAIGEVVDSKLQVKGMRNLMVVDASIAPSPCRGKMGATVTAIAEKGADILVQKYNYTS